MDGISIIKITGIRAKYPLKVAIFFEKNWLKKKKYTFEKTTKKSTTRYAIGELKYDLSSFLNNPSMFIYPPPDWSI
jgi:hypothetical protein